MKKQNKKQEKKPAPGSAEKILEAARDEFALFGLAGARIDRIAERSGVNKAMIYYHFKSKENLYQEIIDSQVAFIADHIEELLSRDRDPEKFLYDLAEFYSSMFESGNYFRTIFLYELATGADRIKSAFAKSIGHRGIAEQMKQMINRGKKAGILRDVDSSHAIISFMGMNIFYYILAPVINQIWEIKNEKKFRHNRPKEVVDLFLHGIMAK